MCSALRGNAIACYSFKAILGALETALLYVHKSSVFELNAGALRTNEGVPRLARASSIPAS